MEQQVDLTGPQGKKLADALEGAYAAFSAHPFPARLTGSPYKPVDEIYADLSSAPLRHLATDKVGPYAGSALWTVGTVDDYKHFLPRILELSVRSPEHMGLESDTIAFKLRRSRWREWPGSEQAAIDAVFFAAWSFSLGHHPGDVDACDWLQGIAILDLRVGDALQAWWEAPSPEAMLNCAYLIDRHRDSLKEERALDWRHVDVDSAAHRQIVAWLLSEPVARRLIETASRSDLTDLDRMLSAEASAIARPLGQAQNDV